MLRTTPKGWIVGLKTSSISYISVMTQLVEIEVYVMTLFVKASSLGATLPFKLLHIQDPWLLAIYLLLCIKCVF
jgi:hypothetical protein